MCLSHDDLYNHYNTKFQLMQHHKYSLTEIDDMIPWEKEVYLSMLIEHLKEEEERIKSERQKNGY